MSDNIDSDGQSFESDDVEVPERRRLSEFNVSRFKEASHILSMFKSLLFATIVINIVPIQSKLVWFINIFIKLVNMSSKGKSLFFWDIKNIKYCESLSIALLVDKFTSFKIR